MEKFMTPLRRMLIQHFPNAEVELEIAEPSERVGGFLIWDGFSGRDHIERQDELWRVLRANLSPDDQSKITAVLTVTPDELYAMREG